MSAEKDVMGGASRLEEGGLDRRPLIKRAAILGTAAWTAPVIVDSLASPAAAATCICDDVSQFPIIYTSPTTATRNGSPYSPKGGAGTFTPCNGVATVTAQVWGGGGGGGRSPSGPGGG